MKLKKKIGTAVASVALVGAGSMAFAYWTSTGSGTGSATAGSASAVTIHQTSVTGLGPGAGPKSLEGTFEVTSPVYVQQVSIDKVETDKDGCDDTDFETHDPDATNAEIEDGDTWGGGSIEFVDKATEQDACQGATVTITYSSN